MEQLDSTLNKKLTSHISMPNWNQLATRFWQSNGLLQDYLDFLLSEIDPLFSQKRLAAEVIDITKETSETTTLTLRPAGRWSGFVAGQFIAVELEIEGVRYRRNYSLSCSPTSHKGTGLISITIKQVAHGKISSHINQNLNKGEIIHISEAMGQFTLTPSSNSSPLFVAGGSGITPIKSMIDHLLLDTENQEEMPRSEPITLVHYAKSNSDIIFKKHFEHLASENSLFSYICHLNDGEGGITADQLALDCPDLSSRDWYICGPQGFMDNAILIADTLSVRKDRIYTESFGGKRYLSTNTKLGASGNVNFGFANRQVRSNGEQSLLELAELAGLKPKFGCRSGICHECKCQRPEGHLINRMTGQAVEDDQITVQACVTVPTGDITLKQW
jgi:ferredoxin-NADP reductase